MTVRLTREAFEFFDVESDAFAVADGEYKIIVAASASDIKSETTVHVRGDFTGKRDYPAVYDDMTKSASDAEFAELYGAPLPPECARPKRGEHTLDSCIDDIKTTLAGRIARSAVLRRAKTVGAPDSPERAAFIASALETPLSAVASMSDGAVSVNTARGLVALANGKYLTGVKLLLKKKR